MQDRKGALEPARTHSDECQHSNLGIQKFQGLRKLCGAFLLELFPEAEGNVGKDEDEGLLEANATHIDAAIRQPHICESRFDGEHTVILTGFGV